MAEILPRHFFFATLIFAIMVTGVVTSIYTIIEGDPTSQNKADTQYDLLGSDDQLSAKQWNQSFYPNGSITAINSLESKIKKLQVSKDRTILSDATLIGTFLSAAWDMVLLVIQSFGFMNDAITNIATYGHLPIPSWVGPMVILFIAAFLVFSILSLLFGKDT